MTHKNLTTACCYGKTPIKKTQLVNIRVPPQTLLGLVLVVKMVTELKYCPFLFSQNGGNWSPFSLLIIQWRACFWCLYIVLDIAWKLKLWIILAGAAFFTFQVTEMNFYIEIKMKNCHSCFSGIQIQFR